jgi:phage tail sheath protein FI
VEIVGATDLGLRLTEDHLGLLNADGINGFRFQRGVRPWGARTASSDPEWRYVNIRRIFIMLRRSLDSGMLWVTFEPNTAATWGTVQRRIAEFLGKLFQMGMFAGGKPEEAFFVKCDAETNPPEEVDQGKLICEIGVAPVSPAEFVIISMVQEMGSTPAG